MKEYFNKFCIYYLNHFNKSYYKKIIKGAKRDKIDYEKIDKDAKEYTDILKNKLSDFNYKGLKKEVYEMINKYIKIKDDMDEGDKKVYLELLSSLCNIYNINLRNELKDYVTELMNPEDVYKELFKCYIEDKTKEEIDAVRVRCKTEYFQDVDEKASLLAKDTKKMCKKYNYVINNKDSIYDAINNYFINKDGYSKSEKSEILRILALVSNIYDINIKMEIENHYKNEHDANNSDDDFSNPLDNVELLMAFLFQKYNNRVFNIRELEVPGYYKDKNYKEEDYIPFQAKLVKKIMTIYLDKINNFGSSDINSLYINTLSIDDMTRIDEIEDEEILTFIEYINKRIEEDIVLRKLNISDVLYHFLVFLVNITDIYSNNIGDIDNNLFTIKNKEENLIIHIGTNNDENTFKFLSKYIVKCIDNNISYNMKNILEDRNSKEKTMLYANKDDLYTKLSILDEIGEENKTIIEGFDKPIISSALYKDKYYGISINKVDELDYEDFFNSVAEVAYYRIIAKLEINKVTNDNTEVLKKLIDLNNVKGSNPLEASYDGYDFNSIKDVINKYYTEISDTLDIYMSSKDKCMEIVDEFSKSMMYIANICRDKKKSSKNNIAIFNSDVK